MATEEVVGIRLALRDRAATQRGVEEVSDGVDEIGESAQRSERKSRGLLDVLRKVGKGAVAATAVGAAGLTALGAAGIRAGVKVAAGNEQARISFSTMLGSVGRADSMIRDLQVFAAKTPFDFPGLQKSASTLISAGIEANKVIPIMTSLGNATSGMGTGSEGIARATVALQQMNAAGKISAEDLNQLRDAGIPVYDLLAAAMGKSVAQVSALRDKGKLGRKELTQLMSALESGKGLERFNGLMEKQSASLTGMWSSFTDTVSMGLGRVLAPWGPTMKIALGEAQAAAGPLFEVLTQGSTDLARYGPAAVRKVSDAVKVAGGWLERAYYNTRAFMEEMRNGQNVNMDSIVDIASGIRVLAVSIPYLMTSMPSLTDTLKVSAVVIGFLARNVDLLADVLPWIAAAFVIWKVAQLGANAAAAASVPLQIWDFFSRRRQNIALTAHTAALNANTRAMGGNTTSETRGTLARVRGTVASVASKGAHLAVAGALKVAALAQRLWNLAMAANPVGLVIVAIAALATGVYFAYKKFDWFRNMIGWVWEKLQALWDIAKKVGSVIGDLFKYTPLGQIISVAKGDGLNVPQLPGRATGGPVSAGQPYVVGERQPEVFVPRQSGTIVPSVPEFDDLRGGLRGSMTANVNVYLDGKQITQSVIKGARREVAKR